MSSVAAVSRDDQHRFSKPTVESIRLIAGFGIEGDSHAGATTQHRYLMKHDPTRANLTQVHLLPEELFGDVEGFVVGPGELGENVTTRGIDLMSIPLGARLHLGPDAVVEITGMRSPCHQIDKLQKGLLKKLIWKDADGCVVRRGGIMGIVIEGGVVTPGDDIRIELPDGEPRPLGVV
ncbi:MAG: hypothetical protein JWR53_1079 [Glaciihabitans sp.]|nr:hypothetical protein [Glaciihabitans sp.]